MKTVDSALDPYVWFIDVSTTTLEASFSKSITFEWFIPRNTRSKAFLASTLSLEIFAAAFVSITRHADSTASFFLRIRNPRRKSSLVEYDDTQTWQAPI